MEKTIYYSKFFILLICIITLAGCKGSETRKVIDSTVDEVTGNRAVKQGVEMKKKIGEINTQQEERIKDMKQNE